MQSSETEGHPVSLENAFLRAKVEHYLQRAEELVRMSRFSSAMEILHRIFSLDPSNRAAVSLQKRIEFFLDDLSENGLLENRAGNNSPRKMRRKEIIMVVDQDERILVSLTDNLRSYGFRAIGAAGFDEAIKTVSSLNPHLIVSEVNFENGPVGFDLYLWVRNNATLHDIPFLYLATKVTRDMLIAGKRLGVDDIITKPLDDEVVIASIINCLSRRNKPTAKA